MTTSQAVLIHELLQHIADLERENGILQNQCDTLMRQLEDTQYILVQERIAMSEPALSDDDTQRDFPVVEA